MAEDRGIFEEFIGVDLPLDQFFVFAIIIAGILKKKSFFKERESKLAS